MQCACASDHVTDRTVFSVLFEFVVNLCTNDEYQIRWKRKEQSHVAICVLGVFAFIQRATHWLCADDYDEMHGIFIDVPSIFLLCFVLFSEFDRISIWCDTHKHTRIYSTF